MGFSGSTIRATLLAQLGIILFNYLFTCAALMRQKPRTGTSEAHVNGKKFRLVKGADDSATTTAEDMVASNNGTLSAVSVPVSDALSASKKGAYTSVFGFRRPHGSYVKPVNGHGSFGAMF